MDPVIEELRNSLFDPTSDYAIEFSASELLQHLLALTEARKDCNMRDRNLIKVSMAEYSIERIPGIALWAMYTMPFSFTPYTNRSFLPKDNLESIRALNRLCDFRTNWRSLLKHQRRPDNMFHDLVLRQCLTIVIGHVTLLAKYVLENRSKDWCKHTSMLLPEAEEAEKQIRET